MSSVQKRTGYQQSENGMLQSGMYACPSVYPVYPPDRTGRRPSQHALLQYASPADRKYQENLRLIQQQQFYNANSSRAAQPFGGSSERYPTVTDEPAGQTSYHTRSQTGEQWIPQLQVRQPEDQPLGTRASPRKALSSTRHFTHTWTCCRNCSAPGPYSSHNSLCKGCETPRCSMCPEILVEGAPIHE
ncbi:hypothetical protein AJ78_03168 [Emergomyces pasteurianus Ep9510]|uniref:Uncharacterized protein n=1 Tax=Emergomyces pasteurianus Ep9510 TaxID=1447872 RepID=A0A1J9PLE5_9EURO|nr:hypothetical protein AJ78_03168 [Emergomyces pasteurianus Ep9510]